MALSRFKMTAASIAAMALAIVPGPASALNIVLRPDASFSSSANGAAALLGFQKAANYWNQTITTNATLYFDVHFDSLGSNILGGTYSNTVDTRLTSIYDKLSTTGNSTIDQAAVAGLRPLTAAGGLGYRTPGTDPATQLLTIFNAGSFYDNNDSRNNLFANANTAINKALGIQFTSSNTLFQTYNNLYGTNFNIYADADIVFSSDFDFDFDPSDGVGVGQYDFVGVAVHEMGHALGFVSGTDDYEYYSLENAAESLANGDAPLTRAEADNLTFLSTLDLFRYGSNNPRDLAGRDLQLDPARDAFFSLGGDLPFNFNGNLADASSSFFATGARFGDGGQASHWQDANAILMNNGCFTDARQVGIMDPTASNCSNGIVTSNDLAAFDAMGWNIAPDVDADRGYQVDTAAIFALNGLAAAVPEPSSWALMLGGIGALGGMLRRRQRRTGTATA